MIRHPIHSLEEFLAHAIEIEREATERYREFELHFALRGDVVLEGLCRNLSQLEGEHLEQLRAKSRGLDLPAIAADEFRWIEGHSPEAIPLDHFHSATTRRDLLLMALRAEAGAQFFFAWVARTTHDARVRELAREMAADEAQHVRWLEQALGYGSISPVPA
jgi:rubrerythrin